VVYDEISRLYRVYRGSEPSCLTYCNFLKYSKSVIRIISCYILIKKTLGTRTYQTHCEKLEKVTELLSQYNPIRLKSSNPTRLPLLDTFRTFCWGEIIRELRKIYRLKELIGIPKSATNNV